MAYLAHVRQYLQSLLILKWQNIKWSTKKAILYACDIRNCADFVFLLKC